MAPGTQKSSVKNLNNLKIGLQNSGASSHDRSSYAMASQSLHKAVPPIKSGQDSHRHGGYDFDATKSMGTAGRPDPEASSQQTQKRKSYIYCIDTNQITSMIDYSIQMMSVSMKDIERQASDYQNRHVPTEFTSDLQQSQLRSKSNSQVSSGHHKDDKGSYADGSSAKVVMEANTEDRKSKAQSNDNMLNSKTSTGQLHKPTPEQLQKNKQERIELFCGGNQEVKLLTYYINSKLESQHRDQKFKQKQRKSASIFKTSDAATSQSEDLRNKTGQPCLDFARIFGFDEDSQIVH